jgi:two-component system, NarL family, nitrate/nitrite response regulator NarL
MPVAAKRTESGGLKGTSMFTDVCPGKLIICFLRWWAMHPSVITSLTKEGKVIDRIRVAVIDDHPLFRAGLLTTLMGVGGIEAVGEGATAADALRIAREHSPDVMLLDVRIAGGGIEAASELARAHPNMRIVMLTACEDEKHVALALEAGARGYLLKGSSGEEIVRALRAIIRGGSYVAPNLAARLLRNKADRTDDNLHDLTSREAEILALLARGMSNKEIARACNCAERTVKQYMTSIMQKLKVRNRVEAVLKFRSRPNKSS